VHARNLLVLSALLVGACASGGTRTPAPEPARPPQAEVPPPETPEKPSEAVGERPPANWQLLDASTDRYRGISLERTYRELLAGKQPKREVVVAVIDGGVDTAHADLRPNLWHNPKETPGNGRDDDGNGLIDDVYGWNYIGGADGRNVHHDTFEVTRLFAQCQKGGQAAAALPCDSIQAEYQQRKSQAEATLGQIRMIEPALNRAVTVLRTALNGDSVTPERVRALRPANADVQQAKSIYEQLAENGITPDVLKEAKEAYENQIEYNFDPEYDPRGIVGDNYRDTSERHYGNRDVTGPDASHGTHVAGIIGAVRGNNSGVEGIASSVKLMALRAVPDGDERDKDIANAIRYAADNGANIINMSFGKSWSPQKPAVDEAVKYAASRGVLMIHAAGNDAEDLDTSNNYPTPVLMDRSRVEPWIQVGASSWKGGDTIAASFSNYGKEEVDVFAPGEDILSTWPGGGVRRSSGTSMAAPVVSGLAALIMSYYPDLSAVEVKRIILETATKLGDQTTLLPGGERSDKVEFGDLSATGGIVNAYEAMKRAEQVAASKR